MNQPNNTPERITAEQWQLLGEDEQKLYREVWQYQSLLDGWRDESGRRMSSFEDYASEHPRIPTRQMYERIPEPVVNNSFKVGDKVVTEWFNDTEDYTCIVAMDDYVGQEGVITELTDIGATVHGWGWPLEALEPVTPPEPVTAVDEVEGEKNANLVHVIKSIVHLPLDTYLGRQYSKYVKAGYEAAESEASTVLDSLTAQLKAKEAEIEGLREQNTDLTAKLNKIIDFLGPDKYQEELDRMSSDYNLGIGY